MQSNKPLQPLSSGVGFLGSRRGSLWHVTFGWVCRQFTHHQEPHKHTRPEQQQCQGKMSGAVQAPQGGEFKLGVFFRGRNTGTSQLLPFVNPLDGFHGNEISKQREKTKKEIFCGQRLQLFTSERTMCSTWRRLPGCNPQWWKLGGLCENKQYIHLPDTYYTLPVHIKRVDQEASSVQHEGCGFKSHTITTVSSIEKFGAVSNRKEDTLRKTVVHFPPRWSDHFPT